MYWGLVDSGLAESASLGHYDYQGVGMFYTWLACEPEAIESNLALVQEILAASLKNPATEQELAQAKSKVKSRVVLGSEKPRNRLFSLGGGWLLRGDYHPLREDLDRLDAVTTEDLARVAKMYSLDQAAIVTVGPRAAVSC